jgi:hypothetical protein
MPSGNRKTKPSPGRVQPVHAARGRQSETVTSKSRGSTSTTSEEDRPHRASATAPSLPPAEVLSFLKETRGTPSWTVQDLAKALNVSAAVAKQVVAFLEAQGYAEPFGRGQWLTTAAGEAVSGSKPPRFTPESAEAALSELAERIRAVNEDRAAPFEINTAIAFGDFLRGRARVQAPDIGIELIHRGSATNEPGSAVEQVARREFLRQLKAKRPTLNIRPYQDWMSSRKHRKLA